MPIFKRNQPVETDQPTVEVENKLRPGVYLFELVVANARGERSAPARVEVRVNSPIGRDGLQPLSEAKPKRRRK